MDANALMQLLSGQPAGAGILSLLQDGNAQGNQGEAPNGAFQAVLAALGITQEGGAASTLANANAQNVQDAQNTFAHPTATPGQPALDIITAIQSLVLAAGGDASLDGLVQAGIISAEDAATIADGSAPSGEIIAQIPGLAAALDALAAAAAAGNSSVPTGLSPAQNPGLSPAQNQGAQGAQNANSAAGTLPNGIVLPTIPADGQIVPAGLALATPQATLNSEAANAGQPETLPNALASDLAKTSAAATASAQQNRQSTAPILPGAVSLQASAVIDAVFSGNSPPNALTGLQLALADTPMAAPATDPLAVTPNSQGLSAQSAVALAAQAAQGTQGAQSAGQPAVDTAVGELMAQFQAPAQAAQAAGGLANAAAKANSFIPGQLAEAAAQIVDGAQQSVTDFQPLVAGRSVDAQLLELASLSPQKAASALTDPAVSTASAGKAAEQVAITISKAVKLGDTMFTVRLDPPQLGKVEVQIEILSNGRVHATLSAERWDTVEALQRESRLLERAFLDAGLKPDILSFTLKDDERRAPMPFDSQDDTSDLSGDLRGGEENLDNNILPPAAIPLGVISSGALDIRV